MHRSLPPRWLELNSPLSQSRQGFRAVLCRICARKSAAHEIHCATNYETVAREFVRSKVAIRMQGAAQPHAYIVNHRRLMIDLPVLVTRTGDQQPHRRSSGAVPISSIGRGPRHRLYDPRSRVYQITIAQSSPNPTAMTFATALSFFFSSLSSVLWRHCRMTLNIRVIV
jgi:hypothetical protein